ncbi:MAG: hypothetical protein Kow0065_23020 [Methylomicrobium sp.]
MIYQPTSITVFAEPDLGISAGSSFDWTAFILLMFFAILSAIESHRPRKRWPKRGWWQSCRVNLGLFVFNSTVLSSLSIASLLILAERFSGTGLLSGLADPVAKALLSLLILDLMFYLWHYACHRFECLWLFHKVHHSEPHLTVSTAFRVHVLEIALGTLLKAFGIVVFGFDRASVMAYELLMMLFVMFHHTNIAFAHEKSLGRLVIVPYLHRVHHSTLRAEHDSNYGAVFSIWDRLFGTLLETEPKRIGLDGAPPVTFWRLIKFGFWPNPQPALAAVASDAAPMIAEAAYYKAERRGFQPGNEMYDWLEAEREVSRNLQAKVSGKRGIRQMRDWFKWPAKDNGVMQS